MNKHDPRHWSAEHPPTPGFLGTTELARLIETHDWAATPLGPIQFWPDEMLAAIRNLLRSPVPMVTLWGPAGIRIYNDAYLPIVAGSHPAYLGLELDAGPEDQHDFNRDMMKAVLAGESLAFREHRVTYQLAGQAHDYWLDLFYSPILDAAGVPCGVLAVVFDVSERVRANQLLDLERARLRQIFDESPSFMSMTSGPECRFEMINRSFLELLGRPGVNLIGKTVLEVVPEVTGSPVTALRDQAFTTGEPRHATNWPVLLQRVPGQPRERRYLDFTFQPLRDHEGAVTGVLTQGRDVTDRVLAEQTARQAESKFQAVTQVMPNHVWMAGPDGVIDWFNDRALNYTGWAARPDLAESWADVLHPDDRAGAQARWRAALASGETYEAEFRILRADDQYRWHLARAIPVRDDDGAIQRWIGTNTDIHERKQAEMLSTRERDRIWSLSQELMLVMDDAGIVLAGNPAITRILGWSEEELAGLSMLDFVDPESRAATQAELRRMAQSGGALQGFEVRCRTREGGYRLVDWTAVPEAGRIHAVGRDITDEREAMREIERTWLLSPIVKVVAALDGTMRSVNPAWSQILGWSGAETIGRNIMDFMAPEDVASGTAGMRQLAEGNPVVELLLVFATSGGGRRRIAWTTVPEAGVLYGFGRDVTAEHEAAVALAASTAERERIWRSTNDLMGTGGIDGFLKSVNPAWTRLSGFTEAELLGGTFMMFADPGDHAKISDAVAQLARGEALRGFETRVVHQDGKNSLISWVAEPAGELFYFVGRDITEQRQAEDALRQSQKMEAVGQLTGGIAHDFNNLLQGITGSLDLLQKRVSQGRLSELDRFITGAMGAANRASALTHRLLAFSRRQPLDPRPVRANPLVASMEDLLRRTMGERIELQMELAGGLWLTLCDPNQLENAVLNLAINARDAMPDGGKLVIETCNSHLDDVYIARRRDIRPGQYVCICVSDTGTGMSQDTMEKAFEPFFTTKPIGQGTGLGLSMIYGFARQSEGFAKLYSELGKGTTVKLFLPRHRGESGQEEAAVEHRPAPPQAAGETVLVVEDEPVVRELIVEILNDLGYAALEAADGPSGLEFLQSKRRIDLLITDIGLPGLNGRQVADAGRALRPELKVLFMTGYAENAAIASGFLEPGMEMITKPFAMEVLMGRIRKFFEEG